MQSLITEGALPRGKKIYYKCTTDAAGVVVKKEVYCAGVRFIETDHGRDLTLFDTTGRVRQKPTEYIQDLRSNKPRSTRHQIGIALDLFYLFGDLYHVDVEHMTAADVERFKQFLMGSNIHPEPGVKVTHRSPHTVNVYLGYIRKYLDTYHLTLEGFRLEVAESVKVPRLAEGGGAYVPKTKRFRSEPTDPKRKNRCPKHIRPWEMQAIAALMKVKKDLCGLCLCILMYGYGLRAGEALGLSTEDLHKEERDGNVYYSIILRNRISDHDDQACKRLYHPKTPVEYSSSYWQDSYWEIPIEERHYDLFMQYYRESRDVDIIRKKHRGKGDAAKIIRTINAETLADSVEGGSQNHYLFVCENGHRLSLQTWNYRLKQYYVAVGVRPDRDKRYLNASHRLRHGFAMWHAHYCPHPVTMLQLTMMMRHSSVASTQIYYTLTEEDELELRHLHNNELHDLIPEF